MLLYVLMRYGSRRRGRFDSERLLLIAVEELAKIIDESDSHHDSGPRQAHEKEGYEQSHKK